MKITINGENIFYEQLGKGKKEVVLLHGWGQNLEMMMPLAKKLEDTYHITILDLPGFGASFTPKKALTIYKYETIIEDFFNKLNITNPILIGHSFGGRIAIIYSSKNKVNKLILMGAPCVREKKKTKLLYKFFKFICITKRSKEFFKLKYGSVDYNNTKGAMRSLFVNTVNEDLSSCAKKIACPTLLVWGSKDTAAPINDAYKLKELINNCEMIEIKDATHYAYLEKLDYVSEQIINFLEKGDEYDN